MCRNPPLRKFAGPAFMSTWVLLLAASSGMQAQAYPQGQYPSGQYPGRPPSIAYQCQDALADRIDPTPAGGSISTWIPRSLTRPRTGGKVFAGSRITVLGVRTVGEPRATTVWSIPARIVWSA